MSDRWDAHSWDCIVVGAGVVGLWTAYHLAKSGKKPLLFDQVCWIDSPHHCLCLFASFNAYSLHFHTQEAAPMVNLGLFALLIQSLSMPVSCLRLSICGSNWRRKVARLFSGEIVSISVYRAL